MQDATESFRRAAVSAINSDVQSDDPNIERTRLAALHGADNVFDTSQLTARFEVVGFMAPFCVVKDRTTGAKGCVEFQHSPRFYFNFRPA